MIVFQPSVQHSYYLCNSVYHSLSCFFFIFLNNLLCRRICDLTVLLIHGFLTLFPLSILDGIYLFMRSDTVEQNFTHKSWVVEVGSMEIISPLTRLSSPFNNSKSAL